MTNPHLTFNMFQVDAFASDIFEGNPAAVIRLSAFWPDTLMQAVAMENNLSETAYVVPRETPGHYDLRWFTPTLEIEFCGHATLATAHVLTTQYDAKPPFHFHTQIGALVVDTRDELYSLTAPIPDIVPTPLTDAIRAAFDMPLESAFWAGDNLYVIAVSPEDIKTFKPAFDLIRTLSNHGVGITAHADGEFAGKNAGKDYDCVSRFFVPAQGINEDPVTGSAHAAIGPYWGKRLGKKNIIAYQASERGGQIDIEIGEKHVTLSGRAVTFMSADIKIPRSKTSG